MFIYYFCACPGLGLGCRARRRHQSGLSLGRQHPGVFVVLTLFSLGRAVGDGGCFIDVQGAVIAIDIISIVTTVFYRRAVDVDFAAGAIETA